MTSVTLDGSPDGPHGGRLSRGLKLLCSALLLAFVAGLVQTWFVVQGTWALGVDLDAIAGGRAMFFIAVLTTLLKAAAVLAAACKLAFVHKPTSVLFSISALCFWWPLSALLSQALTAFVSGGPLHWPYIDRFAIFDVLLVAIGTMYLLLSDKVSRLYGTGSRAKIKDGAPRFWSKLRGR